MPNSFRKIFFIFSIFCLSLILSYPAFSQSDYQNKNNFLPKTYATVSSGIFRDSDEDINKRYGTMFGLRIGLISKFKPFISFRGGLTGVAGNGSFEEKEYGLKGESSVTYIILDTGVYYSKPVEDVDDFNWFVGGGIVLSQIRESTEFSSSYISGNETQSGSSFGLKIAGGFEWAKGFIQLSANPSSGDIDSNLASLEIGFKWDITNIAK